MSLQPLASPTGAFLIARASRTRRRAAGRLIAGLFALAPLMVVACRESLSGFGAGVKARATADQLFGAFADRHVDVVRNAKYEYARVALSRGALSPSRVFDDSAAWTGESGMVRILETYGAHLDSKYVMNSRRGLPVPAKPADGRHVTTLSRLSDNQYRWDTSVDFALGNARPKDLALVVSRLLSAGEGLGEREARADLMASTPRTAAILGTAFSLDTLRPTQLQDGTTAVTLGISVHSDLLMRRFPAFGDYVHRYVDPARIRLLVSDAGGTPYLEAVVTDHFITIRLRSHAGHLVALTGAARPMPDTLVVVADLTVKVKMFNVGFHDLTMDFVNVARGDRERDWVVTAKKEPHWNLPFISARLLRAPLRYPFSGDGALLRFGVRAGDGDAPTVLVRQSRLAVQESSILKFINSLTSTAMDDFGTRVEHEENEWLREVFLALRDDARVVIAP